MRMPGFAPQTSLSSGYVAAAPAARRGVVPQQVDCSSPQVALCEGKAAACIPTCATGNWIGCAMCFAAGAPECLPYLPCVFAHH